MAGLFPQEFIDQVRSANDIAEVVGGYVQLKKAGSSFKGLSPFTKEKTPSFFVNPDKQVFYCFSSGQGGDVIRFLMVYEGLKFAEAVERLAERAKLPLPRMEGRAKSAEPADRKQRLLEIHEKVREFYHKLLMRSPAAAGARKYLQERKINAETAKRFRIGYSPKGWDGLIQWAAGQQIAVVALEKLGLVLKGKGGFYDRFRDRLMIPIQNDQGRTVAFTARLLSGASKEPKYVNSPETELFVKGKLLFGLDRAKRALMETRTAVLCEGQIDCITCQESGLPNTIAPQGTAFTEFQARLLKRYVDEVVLCLDPDAAGRSATMRNAVTLLGEGLRVKAVALPKGSDPDSFIKEKGAEALRALVQSAPGMFEWLAPSFDWDSAAGKMAGLKQMGELWRAVPDAAYQKDILEKLEKLLQIPWPRLRSEFERTAPPRARPRESAVKPATRSSIEEALLTYCLLSERTAAYVLGHVEQEWLAEGWLSEWLADIFQKMESAGWQEACAIAEEDPRAEEKQQLRARLLAKNPGETLGLIDECLCSLQERHLSAKIRAKQEEFRQIQDPARKRHIQAEIQELGKRKDNLSKKFDNKAVSGNR